jgi:hypothetical protein
LEKRLAAKDSFTKEPGFLPSRNGQAELQGLYEEMQRNRDKFGQSVFSLLPAPNMEIEFKSMESPTRVGYLSNPKE